MFLGSHLERTDLDNGCVEFLLCLLGILSATREARDWALWEYIYSVHSKFP